MREKPKHPSIEPIAAAVPIEITEANSQLVLLQTALETVDHGILIADVHGIIQWVNTGFTKLTGYSSIEVVGQTPKILQSGLHDRAFYAEFWQTILAGETWRGEFANRRKSGEIYFDEHVITPVKGANGEITHFVAVMNDVSERMRSAAELDNAQKRLDHFLANSPAVFYALKVVGDGVEPYLVSDKVKELLGYEVEETMSFDWWLKNLHPDDREAALASVSDSLKRGTGQCEYRMRHKDGSYRCVEDRRRVTYSASGVPAELIGVWTDLTEHRQVMDDLLWKTAFMDAQVNASVDGILVVDRNGKKILHNQLMNELFDIPPHIAENENDEVQLKWVTDTMKHPDQFLEKVVYLYSHPDEISRDELELKNGRVLDRYSSPVLGRDGTAFGRIWNFRDITSRKHFEAALQESEARLNEAQHAAQIGSWQYFADGNLIWSDELFEIFQIPKEVHPTYEMFVHSIHPEDRMGENSRGFFRAQQSGASEYEDEYRAVLPDGQVRYMHSRGVIHRNDKGEFVDAVGTVQDITERKASETALRNSEERLRLMADNIQEVFWMTDPSKCEMLYVSKAYESIWGRTIANLFDSPQDWIEAIHPEDRQRIIDAAQSRQCLGTYDEEYRIVRPDGEIRWIRDQAVPIRNEDGSVSRVTGVARDIARRKVAELELRNLNEELESRIQVRTSELAKATAQAEKANLAKSEFLSRMSHELRTPMNSILGYAQLLELEGVSPRQLEYVSRILQGGRHLLGLINEVLEVSRIEADHLSLSVEPVRLREVVSETLAMVEPLAEKAGIVLIDETRTTELYVQADHQRLRQAIINLVSNAIKYNSKDGKVEVSASESEDVVKLQVRDTGVGISKEYADRLFTPFDRLGAEGSAVSGTGLGLALSQKLCQAMGGTIRYRSNGESGGSTFSIELPKAEPFQMSHSAEYEHFETSLETTSRTLLYIEDNLANVELVQDVVARYSHAKLLVAMQGRMGLDLAKEHRPDLILLDLHLPDLSGVEVFEQLKANPELRDIPVIVLSADATQKQIQRLMSMGAHAYLTKPFEIPNLITQISSVIPARVLAAA